MRVLQSYTHPYPPPPPQTAHQHQSASVSSLIVMQLFLNIYHKIWVWKIGLATYHESFVQQPLRQKIANFRKKIDLLAVFLTYGVFLFPGKSISATNVKPCHRGTLIIILVSLWQQSAFYTMILYSFLWALQSCSCYILSQWHSLKVVQLNYSVK